MFSYLIPALFIVSTLAVPLTLRPETRQIDAQTSSFYLNIRNPNRQSFAPEYLQSNGLATPTAESATAFKLTGYGGLSTVSAEDDFAILYLGQGLDDPIQPWHMGPSLMGIYTGVKLETTERGEILRWEDRRFQNGVASFCESGSGIEVVFWGLLPDNCEPVELVATRVR